MKDSPRAKPCGWREPGVCRPWGTGLGYAVASAAEIYSSVNGAAGRACSGKLGVPCKGLG